tara:strand:+ start:2039 stop:2629 length:591 start_codon:yes stop_codon:yes gene_type:complete
MKNVFLASLAVCLSLSILMVAGNVADMTSTEVESNVFIPDPAPVVIEPKNNEPILPTIYIISLPSTSLPYEDLDVFCLAKNIFHEAGIEPRIGKYAVAQVTLNRVASSKYPNSICGVVFENRQFSWANDKVIHWTRPTGRNWDASYRVALNVLEHNERLIGLNDSYYYHADYVNPNWSRKMTEVATIGRHIFYTSY